MKPLICFLSGLLFVTVPSIAESAAVHEDKPTIGRYAALGMTKPSKSWADANPSDDNVILLLDTSTGEIWHCGDVTGACSHSVLKK